MGKIKVTLFALIGLAVLLVPLAGHAAGPNYVAVRGALGWAGDVDRSAGTRTAAVKYEMPYGVSAAYGRRVIDWLRLEAEFNYLVTKVDSITGHFGNDTSASGQDLYYGFMLNALADLHNSTPFTPFVGVGLGGVYAQHDVRFTPVAGSPPLRSDNGKWVLGYQLMAGVGWEFTPGMHLEVMYRFFGIAERSHSQSGGQVASADLDANQMHLFLLGLRFAF